MQKHRTYAPGDSVNIPHAMSYPAPLSAKDKKSFAYITIKDRLPTILGKVIDFVYRSWNGYRQKYGQQAEFDITMINAELSKLHYQIQTNKPLERFSDLNFDVGIWNKAFDDLVLQENIITWYEGPWLFIETYMYRKINESFFKSKHLTDFDPFSEIKYFSFYNSKAAINALCEYIHKINKNGWDNLGDMEDLFHRIFKVSLWGNKYDLSLSNMSVTQAVENPLMTLDSYDQYLMRNDIQFVFNHLNRCRENSTVKLRIINIILDNSGFELFTDLLLCYFLLKANFTDRVILYGKIMPWYVSDATSKDVFSLLTWLSHPDETQTEDKNIYNNFLVEKPKDCDDHKEESMHELDSSVGETKSFGKWFAKEFLKLMQDKVINVGGESLPAIEYRDHFYWTLPYDYSKMKDVDASLYDELSRSILTIFKGDLNFRKLVGDLSWDFTTPFREALRGFKPSPLVVMRTNKSDLICGLSPEMVEIAEMSYPKNWMISGDYAIVEFDL